MLDTTERSHIADINCPVPNSWWLCCAAMALLTCRAATTPLSDTKNQYTADPSLRDARVFVLPNISAGNFGMELDFTTRCSELRTVNQIVSCRKWMIS